MRLRLSPFRPGFCDDLRRLSDLGRYGKPAGGLDAVVSSVRYVVCEAGIARGTRACIWSSRSNPLDSFADGSRPPTSKSVVVTIARSREP